VKLIGLVGGIASGKSCVSQLFRDLGAEVINADQLAHQVMQDSAVIQLLVQRWGEIVIDDKQQLDRSAIAKVVFAETKSGQAELDWLESQLHPRIRSMIEPKLDRWRSDPKVSAAVLDAPVLIKAGWHLLCDELVFVEASLPIRLQRARKRGWADGELQRREKLQTPLSEKRRLSTFVIQNDGDSEFTARQVKAFWNQDIVNA